MMRRLLTLCAFVAGLLAAQASAQDAQKLRIAGLSLGAPTPQLAEGLAEHGFFALPVPTDPRAQRGEINNPIRIAVFQRRDGHTLRIGVEPGETPVIRALDYGMGDDIDTFELIRNHLRGLFGGPKAVHGAETGVRVAIWEIPGTDMTIEGLLITKITLIRDPGEGHSLTVRESRLRPEFVGPSRRAPENVVATE